MEKQTHKQAILKQVVELVEETRFKANLVGKPFALGLLTESPNGILAETLRESEGEFQKLGADLLEWRDDALRGRDKIAGEELLVSVQRI